MFRFHMFICGAVTNVRRRGNGSEWLGMKNLFTQVDGIDHFTLSQSRIEMLTQTKH